MPPLVIPEKYDDEQFGRSKYERAVSATDYWLGEILKNIDLGILAIGAVPRKSEKLERGSLGEDIRIGNIRISDGNWVYADKNGVIISENELELD